MKYSITRKLNLKRFFPEMEYETVDFTVLEANSQQEALDEVNAWIADFIKSKKK